jgi:hypothetical protein
MHFAASTMNFIGHCVCMKDILHAPAGLLVAGSPVGVPRFLREHAQQCEEGERSLVDTLDQLPAQEHWLLLHGSLQLQVGTSWNLGALLSDVSLLLLLPLLCHHYYYSLP